MNYKSQMFAHKSDDRKTMKNIIIHVATNVENISNENPSNKRHYST